MTGETGATTGRETGAITGGETGAVIGRDIAAEPSGRETAPGARSLG